MKQLLGKIRACAACAGHLELGPNPVVAASPSCKLVIIGQAPGRKVHTTGIPWNDKSGETLRSWLGIPLELFYDHRQIALIPMGFCFPGKNKSGDLPPRRECAPLWHPSLMAQLKKPKLTLLVGKYSQDYYLKEKKPESLTDTVRDFQTFLPDYFPLPHPSPRNNIWRSKNPWFEREVLPALRKKIKSILEQSEIN